MSDPIDIISLADALTLVAAVPDIITSDGAVPVRNHAIAWLNMRNGDEWRCQFTREAIVTLPSGKAVTELLPSFDFAPEQIASQFVCMTHPDGRVFRFPAILLQAMGAWAYVALERGLLIPVQLPSEP